MGITKLQKQSLVVEVATAAKVLKDVQSKVGALAAEPGKAVSALGKGDWKSKGTADAKGGVEEALKELAVASKAVGDAKKALDAALVIVGNSAKILAGTVTDD